MIRMTLACALALVAPSLVASAESLEKWDDRTSVEDDNTHTLDSVDTGRTHDLDDVDTGHTETLDSVESRRDGSIEPPAAPATSNPMVHSGHWEEQANQARDLIAQADARLRAANAAYGEMRATDYPRGDAAAKVAAEREAAEAALNSASDYDARIKRAARDAGYPL